KKKKFLRSGLGLCFGRAGEGRARLEKKTRMTFPPLLRTRSSSSSIASNKGIPSCSANPAYLPSPRKLICFLLRLCAGVPRPLGRLHCRSHLGEGRKAEFRSPFINLDRVLYGAGLQAIWPA